MLFPGQGSQAAGMLADLAATDAVVAQTWAEASDVLGYDMARLVADDPDGQLNQTEYTQPALVAAGVAVWRAWQRRDGAEPALIAGHSLGEYTALVAAGALDFGDALRLTRLRGQAMQTAVEPGAGAMAAVIGMSDEAVREVCAAVTTGADFFVSAANFNAPKQVVIAGHADAVQAAAQRAKVEGAKLVKVLPVSVPSHCALMRPAAERLADALQEVPLHSPRIDVLHNVDAQPRDSVEGIRNALVAQLDQSVLWSDSIKAMAAAGCTVMLECGPGKVLTGLNKRIDKSLSSVALGAAGGIDAGLAAVQPAQ